MGHTEPESHDSVSNVFHIWTLQYICGFLHTNSDRSGF